MRKSPLKAFNDFISLNQGEKEDLFKKEPEYYDSLIEPFLLNPEKYSEHVDIMMEAKWASLIYRRLVLKIPKPFRNLIFRKSLRGAWSNSYTLKLDKLRSKLESNIVPCELMLDFLPTRILDTPAEWEAQNLTIHLLEIKTSVLPEGGLIPFNVELKVDFGDETGIQIIESFPVTDFSEEGEYQVDVSNEGKFSTKSKESAEFGIKGSGKLLKGAIGFSAERGVEKTNIQSSSFQIKYKSKVIKIISSAVKNKAVWKILRTIENIPIGGMSYYLTILIPGKIKKLKYKCYLSTDLEGFGLINISDEDYIKVSQLDKN